MALQKQNIDVILTNGVDNKSDSKLTLGASLRTLENAVFTKRGVLNKRFGNTSLSSIDTSGSAITNMKAAMVYQETELLLAAQETIYSYSDSTESWVNKGSLTSASVESSDIITNSAEQTKATHCSASGISLYAWEDSRGGIRYSVKDDSTGTFFVSDAELTSSGDTPQCLTIGTSLMCFYGDSTNLKYKFVSVGSPTELDAGGNTRTNLHTDHLFDFVTIGTKAYGFYKHTTATTAALIEVNSLGAVSNTVTLSSHTIVDTLSISTYNSSNVDYLNLVWKHDANTVKCAIHTNSFVEVVAAKNLDATSSTDIEKITSVRSTSTTDQITAYYQVPGTANSDDYIVKNTLDLDGTVGTRSVFIRSLGLAAKAFTYNGKNYIPTLHDSELQATIFVLDINGAVIAKFSAGTAGTHESVGAFLSPPVEKTPGVVSFVANSKGRIRSENATLFSLLGVTEQRIDFEGSNTYAYSNINKNMNVIGGILHSYDGHSTTEQGFHLFPEGVAVTGTSTSGGFMSDGTYQYSCVYQWVDARGNVHRSAPSIAFSDTLSGGGSTQKNTITIPTLRVTRKSAPRSEVTIEVYRTEDSGTIFYNVGSISSPTENDLTADSVTFEDTLADASIISNEILYTTGGVLDNIAAPSCDIIISHENRLFISGLQNKNEIRYSKITRQGEGVAFNEALSIKVDPRGGDITALASMDSNLIIFKRDNIYRVAGDGPSDTGAGATFTEPELIASAVGCVAFNSVVLGPDGLYFKSAKGIYHLSRSLQVDYIGANVEDFNQYNVTSSKLLDDVNEIRFATVEGNTLVYNYYFKQWSVFTGQSTVDSAIWNSTYIHVSSTGKIFQEDSSTYLDDGAAVSMKIATGWIRVGSLQGFQRVYRATILGNYKSRHILRVSVYNDYSDAIVQTSEFTPASVLSVDSGFYGDEDYGDIAEYGSSDNGVYQFETHIKKQKSQSVRFVIEDIIDNGVNIGAGESYSITGLTIQIGSKRGLNKVSASKSR